MLKWLCVGGMWLLACQPPSMPTPPETKTIDEQEASQREDAPTGASGTLGNTGPSGPTGPVAPVCSDVAPSFEIGWSAGTLQRFAPSDVNANFVATVSCVGDERWRLLLLLDPSAGAIDFVRFPLGLTPIGLDGGVDDPSNDTVLYPALFGLAVRRSNKVNAPSTDNGRVGPDSWEDNWSPYSRDTFAPGADTDVTGRTFKQLPCYPGACFAPFVIMHDDDAAYSMASTTWPPRSTTPQWNQNAITFKYQTLAPLLGGEVFSVDVQITRASSSPGLPAWHKAVAAYRAWLEPNLKSAGLEPTQIPTSIRHSHGFINAHLGAWNFSNTPSANGEITTLASKMEDWSLFKSRLPWIQFWGQMDAFDVATSSESGCCGLSHAIDPSYATLGLPAAISGHRGASGGLVGTYIRPWRYEGGAAPICGPGEPTSALCNATFDRPAYTFALGGYIPPDEPAAIVPAPTGNTFMTQKQWLSSWMASLETELGPQDVFYVDVAAIAHWGEPLSVAYAFAGDNAVFPPSSFAEGLVDVMPTAFLASGELNPLFGGKSLGGPAADGNVFVFRNAPELGRLTLDAHSFFVGSSNAGHVFWGGPTSGDPTLPGGCTRYFDKGDSNHDSERNRAADQGAGDPTELSYCAGRTPGFCHYWIERQAFLLGAKFDARQAADYQCAGQRWAPVIDQAMGEAIAAWEAFDFWAAEPRYRDVLGVTSVPADVRARTFVATVGPRAGHRLIAVDNWAKSTGSLIFEGETVAIPSCARLLLLDADADFEASCD